MHDLLFTNQRKMDPANFKEHATSLSLDLIQFEDCLKSGKYAKEIRKDMAEGRKAGVRGTPTSLVGFIGQNGLKVKAVKRIRGAVPYNKFKDEIDNLLKSQEGECDDCK